MHLLSFRALRSVSPTWLSAIGFLSGLVALAFIQRQVTPQDLLILHRLPRRPAAALGAPSSHVDTAPTALMEQPLDSLRAQPAASLDTAVDQSSTTQMLEDAQFAAFDVGTGTVYPSAAFDVGTGTAAAAQEVPKNLPGLPSQVALNAPGQSARCGSGPHIVELVTEHGIIRIELLPNLSCSSVAYWREAASKTCKGDFYRTEDYMLQGKLSCMNNSVMVSKGDCPVHAKPELVNQKCLSENFCGCHGPVGTHGSFAWAGAGSGPDFFVQTRLSPGGDYWHTSFGQILDEASWTTISGLQRLLDKLGPEQKGFNYGPESFRVRFHGSPT